ncbi:MAG TPA: Gfo/Idh/MocA family oxidoreductase [Chthonomonadaceae bacterium]|nr:Gfo/Idh/MocA family oxidoreductase [Chthonomonadaceae bacterium]
MNELAVAVIGCAGPGRLHLAAWGLQSGVRIAAVCDPDTVVAARAAMKAPGAAAFPDIKSMLGLQAFDVVDVCVPLEERAEVVAAALRSGAHVVCEPSIGTTSAEARSLAAIAADRERLLMPAFIHRFHPPVLFAREMIESDDVGRPVSFRCRFSDPRSFLSAGPELALSGVARETGQHGIDLFRALVGEAEGAVGLTSTITPGFASDDVAAIVLRSERGAIGVVEAVQNLPGSRNLLEVYGTVGACLLDYDAGTVRYRSGDVPIWQTHDVSGLNGLEACLAHFADAVRGLQAPALTAADSVRALEILEAVERGGGRPG